MWLINTITSLLLLILPILVNVAFVTLLERKILGLSQLRLGPNKVRFGGLLQPFTDAIKLFAKQSESNINSNSYLFNRSPIAMFVLAVILWLIINPTGNSLWNLPFLIFIIVLGLGVYPLLLRGWASNSKYAMIGAIRGVAQTISYEISLALFIIRLIMLNSSFGFIDFLRFQVWLICPWMIFLWLIMAVAETNRTPFDFAEGESELVSGFNIEYGSVGFVLIFLREYAIILIFSSLSTSVLASLNFFTLTGAAIAVLVSCIWIIFRRTFPRYRYDLLISTAWKSLLPETLGILTFVCIIII